MNEPNTDSASKKKYRVIFLPSSYKHSRITTHPLVLFPCTAPFSTLHFTLLMAHYSSLFTFGLLSDRDCPSPLPSPDSNSFYQFRKSSLPTSALSKPSDIPAPSEGLRSRPQFTNPFASSPEATTELRSFLSLDLAADQSWSTYRPNKLLSPLDSDMAPTCPPCTVNAPP